MKSSVILAIAGAVAVRAEFPDCVNHCISLVNAQAASYGCYTVETACLCKNLNYYYAIRDCSTGYCQDTTMGKYANEVCPNPGSGAAPASGSAGSGGAASTPVTTSEVVATVTSGGSTFVTTSLTTMYGAGGAGGASGSGTGAVVPTAIDTSTFTFVATSGTDVLTVTPVTTISGVASGTATFVTASPSASGSGSVTGGVSQTTSAETSEASSTAASSSSSSAMGVQKTAAPIAGLLAAAGLAAALL